MNLAILGSGWGRALLALAAVWLVILGLHHETLGAMVTVWNRSETFTHCWVVPPIALWLAWRLRHQVLALSPRPVFWVWLPLLAMGLVWLLGQLVAVNTAPQLALVAMLVLSVPALLGLPVTRVLAFPLAFLFFAVPVGDFLTPTLMQWTADVTITALRLSGIPVYREGLQFVIPSGTWSVIEACSGMRYLLASTMVGALFAYLNYQSPRRRWLFVAVSIVVPVLANWLRAYMIVMLGHYSNNQLAVGADHLVYGWVLFGIIIMALYWIGARWAEPEAVWPSQPMSQAGWSGGAGALVAAGAVVLAMLPLQALRHIEAGSSDAPVVLALPNALAGGWQQAAEAVPVWPTGFLNPSAESRADYRAPDGRAVSVYLAYYRHQNDKRKLVSSGNHVLTGEPTRWNALDGPARSLSLPGQALVVRETRLLLPEPSAGVDRRRLRVWRCYWVDGRWVAGDIAAKLWGAWSRLAGHGDESAVMMVAAEDGQDGAEVDQRLTAFLAAGLPGIAALLETQRRQVQAR